MTTWNPILAAALLLILGSSPAWSQASGDRLATDLNNLRQQQRQLERDIRQYQRSIELLRGNQPAQGDISPPLQALEAQLEQTRNALFALSEQEITLQQQLMPSTPAPAPQTSPAYDDPEAEDVARLKTLLNNFYAAEAAEVDATGSGDTSTDRSRTSGDYPTDKVRLSGPEGVSAIQHIDRILGEERLLAHRREPDIIFHIEIRRDGKLVSSSSHSLKSLGRSQYVSKVSLKGGTATVSVRRDSWATDLTVEQDNFYLITLNLPRDAAAELHIIPVDELKATYWRDLPSWLPYIGTIPAAPAQS